MNKLICCFYTTISFLLNTRINIVTRLTFVSRYVFDIIKIIIIRREVKVAHFINGRKLYYSGNHTNLPFDHVLSHLTTYSQYYLKTKTVIDVGASFGTFSLMVNFLNSKAFVYSFEPSKESFALLKKNCTGIKNIEIINKAVGNSNTKVHFIHNQNYPEGSQVGQSSDNSNYLVDQTTLDDFTELKQLKDISLLKIDVEGYELQVLAGATKTLPITECLIIEVDVEKLKLLAEVFTYIDKFNFTLINIGVINYNYLAGKQIGSLDLIFQNNDYCKT